MTLDAILGAVLFDQLGNVDAAHAAIPIQCDDHLFYASSVNVEPIEHSSASFAASLRAQHDFVPSWIKKNKDGTKLHKAMGLKRRRDFGNVLSSYRTCITEQARWYCTGDEAAISELLGQLYFIGKKRSQGFGEVSSWEVNETTLDGLVDDEGFPMRPIPASRYEKGRDDLVPVDAAWKPAYWQPVNRAKCFAPKLY